MWKKITTDRLPSTDYGLIAVSGLLNSQFNIENSKTSLLMASIQCSIHFRWHIYKVSWSVGRLVIGFGLVIGFITVYLIDQNQSFYLILSLSLYLRRNLSQLDFDSH
jgi:hypothetical protein